MAFKIKTFKTILNDMVNWMVTNTSRINNFRVGSVIRTTLESVAIELEGMYFQMHKAFRNAIQYSIFNSFSFYRIEATKSTGTVTIGFSFPLTQKLTIPKGFQFSTIPYNGSVIYFSVTEDMVCLEGSLSAQINVECDQAGTIGNVAPYYIRLCVVSLPQIVEVYNEQAFSNGMGEESLSDLKKRFNEYIQNLAKGTIDSVIYGCLSVPGVTGASLVEDIGSITVYAHNSSGLLPDDLKSLVLTKLIDYRAAGVEPTLLAPTLKPVDITSNVVLASGYNSSQYSSTITDSITSYLNSFPVAKTLVVTDLIKYILNIDEAAIINVSTNISSNVVTQTDELIRAGNISTTIIQ